MMDLSSGLGQVRREGWIPTPRKIFFLLLLWFHPSAVHTASRAIPLRFVPDASSPVPRFVSLGRAIAVDPTGITVGPIRLRWVGGKARRVNGEGSVAAHLTVIRGRDPSKWHRLPLYPVIRLQEVYPGVDLILTAQPRGRLELQWIVHPGADPSRIGLETACEGCTLRIQQGNLLVEKDARPAVRIQAPRAFQGAESVAASWVRTNRGVGLRLGSYETGEVLVIDPGLETLSASTYLGGSGNDFPSDLAVDSSGNVIVVGSTNSGDFPLSGGALDSTSVYDEGIVARFGGGVAVGEHPLPGPPFHVTLDSRGVVVLLDRPAYLGATLYTPDGRRIRRVTIGHTLSGPHRLVFSPLPHGVYVLKLRVGDALTVLKWVH